MEQSARMWMPWAQASQASQVTPQQLQQILQMLEQEMPALEVLHALHAEALKDPAVKSHPAMARVTEQTMNNLHARVAAAGFLRRLLSGDPSGELLTLLQEQLTLIARTRDQAKEAFERLHGAPAGRANPAVQGMGQVVGLLDQFFTALRPLLVNMVPPDILRAAAQ